MVEIRPFRAIRYTAKAGNLEDLVAQPYDKITPDMQDKYYARSDFNYCKLTLPKEDNRYEISKQRLEQWFKDNIFIKDANPGFYVYFQDFELNNRQYTRKGFFAAVKLHHFDEGIVLPHEWTHKGPKIDRLNMLKATQKFLEPGFMLYNDPEKKTIQIFDEVAKREPDMDVIDDLGVRNRIWKIEDPKLIKAIQEVLAAPPGQVVIADGHHRYETACGYRDELRKTRKNWTEDDAANFRMTLLVPVQDEGLIILPTHRVLAKHRLTPAHWDEIKKYFTVQEVPKEDIEQFMLQHPQHAFVIYTDGKAFGIILKDLAVVDQFLKEEHADSYKTLDVVIVSEVLFKGILKAEQLHIDEDIFYIRWLKDALAKVDSGEATLAVIMNPTKADQVLEAAKKGERMPQKSTDFYPKMISGLLMEDISEGERLPS